MVHQNLRILCRKNRVPEPPTMEDIASLINNEEELLLRAEELYEEEVEIKSRNDPTLCRLWCAKDFWSKMRRYLPLETVHNLTDLMNKRRAMREQSLRKALRALQKDDCAPRTKRVVQELGETDAKTDPKTPRTTRPLQETGIVSEECSDRSKKRLKRILNSKISPPSPVRSGTPRCLIATSEHLDATPKHRNTRKITPLQKIQTHESSVKNTATMPLLKGDDSSNATDAYFRRIDFSVFSRTSKTFLLQVELLYHDYMSTVGTRDAEQFWSRVTRQFPNADLEELRQRLCGSTKYPKIKSSPKEQHRCVRIFSKDIAMKRVVFFDTPDRGTYL